MATEDAHVDFPKISRILQADDSATSKLTQTEIIQSTCAVYGSIFIVLFLIFLFVRPRYPHYYNLKKSFPDFNTPIAEDAFGQFSWCWKVFSVSYEDIREQCGMDAMTTIRLLEFGVKLSLVGVFNSVYLLPIYASMGDAVKNSGVSDPVMEVSLSNLAQGSSGAIATTFAAYTLFGAAMYFIIQDFRWFTTHRHQFLSDARVQNYSIYLSGLPPEMQTNNSLYEYFGDFFSHNEIANAHVAVAIKQLQKKVAKRDALIVKFEHAINVQTIKGERPMHKTKKCGGEKVESVPTYDKDLELLNEDIETMRKNILTMQKGREADVETGEAESDEDPDDVSMTAKYHRKSSFSKSAKLGASIVKSAVAGGEDGASLNAAFVSFRSLTSANIARQTLHQDEPWSCVPVEPPMPEFVNWKNVGKSNTSKQFGELISLVLTATLCVFWTIPVGFVASLSNVEKLTELLPFLKYPVENYAWFSSIMALLAPLLLVAFISLLPTILLAFVKFEGLIEIETMQHPSLFSKLATFTILQTFFISTIAGTLFTTLEAVSEKPAMAFTIVAQALPAQSALFIQLIIVQNLLALGIELLRISPIALNAVRKVLANKLGHNLTEKERGGIIMGLRPLDNPVEYEFGRELGSKSILILMVLYVYGAMSPITAYFTLLVFGLLAIGFRNQFIFIYPPANDSGGKLWINFTKLSVVCMIIAEIILFSVLLLKKTFAAAVLMTPLIITTVLFNVYLKRRHYAVTQYLPIGECAAVDRKNRSERMTYESFKDAYLQPALGESVVLFPDNYNENGAMARSHSDSVLESNTRRVGDHRSVSSDNSPREKRQKKYSQKDRSARESENSYEGKEQRHVQEQERRSKRKSKKDLRNRRDDNPDDNPGLRRRSKNDSRNRRRDHSDREDDDQERARENEKGSRHSRKEHLVGEHHNHGKQRRHQRDPS